jgi:hypothetical protein
MPGTDTRSPNSGTRFTPPQGTHPHPPGEETQWDWVELPDPPPGWGWGKTAHLLVGALSHSGCWRAVLCESENQPHLIDGLDRVTHALGGVSKDWRFDRMATVISPGTGRVSASFAAVAKHYGVTVRPCPPRRGNRKGVVEKANHVAAQRFWRTLPDDVTVEAAQVGLDAWCGRHGDARVRSTTGGKTTVGALAAAEPLRPVPATLSVARVPGELRHRLHSLARQHGHDFSHGVAVDRRAQPTPILKLHPRSLAAPRAPSGNPPSIESFRARSRLPSGYLRSSVAARHAA